MYAAFLIPAEASSDPEVLSKGYDCVPDKVFVAALDHDIKTRDNPGQRRITFSRREWLVKSCTEACGPGPNYFSDGAGNVWVDGQGKLHLKITNVNGQWRCAEIICREPLGYGS